MSALRASPAFFLMSVTFINWLGFASWHALLNNFAVQQAGATGWDIGVLQSVREIPGFLAFTALVLFLFLREQSLAYLSLLIMALGVALTGFFPSIGGLLLTTFVMSVGFHYFETANQALALQILPKGETPRILGQVAGAAAGAQLVAYGCIVLAWTYWTPDFKMLYLVAGCAAAVCTIAAFFFFRRFQGHVVQRKGFVLKKRYGLYYALTFMSGARRQIFIAFGGFLLVQRFGYDVSGLALLLFITCTINLVAAPLMGRLVAWAGERHTIMLENMVLIVVFSGYALTSSGVVAGALFILDGIFFTLVIAQRTYFQKIADPADIAPTAGVAFTINHIAAVFIPVGFGLIWIYQPSLVFAIGGVIATISLALSFLVPRHPGVGHEMVMFKKGFV